MKLQVEQLIERMADKSLTFGCEVKVLEPRLFMGDAYIRDKWRVIGYEKEGNDITLCLSIRKHCSYRTKTAKGTKEKVLAEYKWVGEDMEILGHPILIGTVLQEIYRANKIGYISECVEKWTPLGFTKSLQEIFEQTEWEEKWVECGSITGTKNRVGGAERKEECPKQPEPRALFEFLLSLKL
jgi:hypothetical protein